MTLWNLISYFPTDPDFFDMTEYLLPIVIFYIAVFGVALVLSLTEYLLRGFALYQMSKARGLQYEWLGFVPYLHRYQYGQVAGEIDIGSIHVKNTGVWLAILPFIYNLLFGVGYFGVFVLASLRMTPLIIDPSASAIASYLISVFIMTLLFMFVMLVAQVFWILFKYIALFRIFTQYHPGSQAVFYLILSMFIPLAESILLFTHRNKPLLPIEPVAPIVEPPLNDDIEIPRYE